MSPFSCTFCYLCPFVEPEACPYLQYAHSLAVLQEDFLEFSDHMCCLVNEVNSTLNEKNFLTVVHIRTYSMSLPDQHARCHGLDYEAQITTGI